MTEAKVFIYKAGSQEAYGNTTGEKKELKRMEQKPQTETSKAQLKVMMTLIYN